MKDLTIFSLEIMIPLVMGFGLLYYMRDYLKQVLTDICGTKERSDFWTGFICVLVLLLPMFIVVLFSEEGIYQESAGYIARDIMQRVLFGKLVALSIIGFVILSKSNPQQKLHR